MSTRYFFSPASPQQEENSPYYTPPQTPRLPIEEDVLFCDEGILQLNQSLPVDPSYKDEAATLSRGKPQLPHDNGEETHKHESPLYQWSLGG